MQNKLLYSELTKGSSFILAFFFLALFSFQDAVFVVFLRFFTLFSSAVLVRRLIYYTALSEVCQAFFQTFFKSFLDFRLLKCLPSTPPALCLPTGWIESP